MYADDIEKERSSGGYKKSFSGSRGSGIDGKWKRDMFQTANRSPKTSFVTKKRQQTSFMSKAGAAAIGGGAVSETSHCGDSRQNDFKPKMRVVVERRSRVVKKGGRGGF
ncbi:hypothetical protein CRE_22235 [Caenorhabditis remanei]|uniref:Uncharacterized protein n=1 Tax=Caenorhabditis remanei TaxID=31234 RepID=E3NRT2_CAERE|nr:hypothetical protein CRE_22235 [Caenorhabditis remanei]